MNTATVQSTQQKKPAHPNNIPLFVPYLAVESVEKTVKLYETVFGFETLMTAPGEDGVAMHAEMRYFDMVIMFGDVKSFPSTTKTPHQGGFDCPVCLYFYVEDVDAHFNRTKTSGLTIASEPADQPYGDRNYQVKDHDGYLFTFASFVGGGSCSAAE
jgi:uncharacterized glyoxalase superfamily protein PhnB